MKVQKVKSREYNKKRDYKYRVIIPKKILEIAGIKAGDELNVSAKKREIRLKKKTKSAC